jgi:glycerol-3-phosphate dehydrogenase subunit C
MIREIISGKLDPAVLNEPEFKEIMDSCINCKRCLTECPSGVDVPWVALMGRTHYTKKHGEDLTSKILTNTATLCKAASSMAPVTNLANKLAPIRSVTEKLMGIEKERKLPKFSGRTLRQMFKDKLRKTGRREVVFFLNCYSNYNDPRGEGMSIIKVLEKNDINVIVPELKCCGIARISSGAAHKVMKDINENIRVLSEYANQGTPIVFTEPSCALAVKMEYPRITGSALSKVVADHCYDITQFLLELHKAGELNLDLGTMDLTIGYHNPCHLRSLGVTKEPMELLNLIPGVTTIPYSDKCCGMGGTYGLKKKNYDVSMKIGQRLFDEINASGVDQVATGCSSCAMQIHQGTNKPVMHPVALLALAYQRGQKTHAA